MSKFALLLPVLLILSAPLQSANAGEIEVGTSGGLVITSTSFSTSTQLYLLGAGPGGVSTINVDYKAAPQLHLGANFNMWAGSSRSSFGFASSGTAFIVAMRGAYHISTADDSPYVGGGVSLIAASFGNQSDAIIAPFGFGGYRIMLSKNFALRFEARVARWLDAEATEIAATVGIGFVLPGTGGGGGNAADDFDL